MYERDVISGELQVGAVLLPLGQELGPLQDLYAAHIISGIVEFSKQGGLLQEEQSQEAFEAVCFMTEKPNYFTTYPYLQDYEAAEKILVVVDPDLHLIPQDFAKNITTDALCQRSYLFPQQGQLLNDKGLTSTLPIGLDLAVLVKENLDRTYYELDWSPADILRKIRHARAAKQVSATLNLQDLREVATRPKSQKPSKKIPLAEVLAACPNSWQRGDLWFRANHRDQKKYLKYIAKHHEGGDGIVDLIEDIGDLSESDSRRWVSKRLVGQLLVGSFVVEGRAH